MCFRGRPRLFTERGLTTSPGALNKKEQYDAIVFLFDVREESRVAKIILATWTYERT